ncbi:MAG: hypothetical protein K6F92_07380 [Lachnospiraceae bacterium]|nr:hypothetical protein [Lachnospiraceae bacterium]
MYNKRILAGLVCAAMFISLAGCHAEDGPDFKAPTNESTEAEITTAADTATQEETTAQAQTEPETTTIDEFAYKDKLVVDEPGVEAFEFEHTWENDDYKVLLYGEYFLIVESRYGLLFEESDESTEDVSGTMVRLLNIKTGEEEVSKLFPDMTAEVNSTIIMEDGSICLTQRERCSYVWLDKNLEISASFDYEEWIKANPDNESFDIYGVMLRHDEHGGYYAYDGDVWYLDMNDGQLYCVVDIEEYVDLYLSGILYDDNELVVGMYVDGEECFYNYDISDCKKANPVSKTCICKNMYTYGDRYVGMYTNYEYDDKRFFSGIRGESEVVWCAFEGYKSWGNCAMTDNGLIMWASDEENDGLVEELDFKSQSSRKVNLREFYGDEGYVWTYGTMNDDRELYSVYRFKDGNKSRIFMVDMDVCATAGDIVFNKGDLGDESDAQFVEALQIHDPMKYMVSLLKQKYECVNEYAQALGYEKDLVIVIGDDVHEYDDVAFDFNVEACNDENVLWQALAKIEKVTDQYPDGFFAQFKDENTPEGVILCLTGAMIGKEEYETVNQANGLASTTWTSHNVFIDVYGLEFEQTFYHEFSHVIDNYINNLVWLEDDPVFSEAKWNALNPEGFTYEDSYANYDTTDETFGQEYTIYGYQSGVIDVNGVYFIDNYAMLFSTEDRARLTEYACVQTDNPALKSEKLQAKLKYMSEYIRHYFDTTGWPEVTPWEKAIDR